MNDKDLEWELVETKHLIQDEWIDFRENSYKLPDGTVHGSYYNFTRRNYVVIIAQDTNGDYLCVKQYRHGIRQVTTEFPAGAIENQDYSEMFTEKYIKEVALPAAIRELREETGYVSDEWKHLVTIPDCASISSNYGYIFIANNCKKAGDLHLDDTEFLNVEYLTDKDIDKLIKDGKFQQVVHMAAWMMR